MLNSLSRTKTIALNPYYKRPLTKYNNPLMKSYYHGKLIVKPLRAELTRDVDTFSKMDPYVQLKLGDKTQRTKSNEGGGKQPSWKDVFEFDKKNEDFLTFDIYDDDPGSDDLVGSGKISLDVICTLKPKRFADPVKLEYKGKDVGKVYFDIEFQPDAKPEDKKQPSKGGKMDSGPPKKDSPRGHAKKDSPKAKPKESHDKKKGHDDKGKKDKKRSNSGSDSDGGKRKKK